MCLPESVYKFHESRYFPQSMCVARFGGSCVCECKSVYVTQSLQTDAGPRAQQDTEAQWHKPSRERAAKVDINTRGLALKIRCV